MESASLLADIYTICLFVDLVDVRSVFLVEHRKRRGSMILDSGEISRESWHDKQKACPIFKIGSFGKRQIINIKSIF
jgi:hypothetical protein